MDWQRESVWEQPSPGINGINGLSGRAASIFFALRPDSAVLCLNAGGVRGSLCDSEHRIKTQPRVHLDSGLLLLLGFLDGNLVVAVGIKICNCNSCWTSWRDVTAARRRRGLKAEHVSGLKHFIEQPFTPSLTVLPSQRSLQPFV